VTFSKLTKLMVLSSAATTFLLGLAYAVTEGSDLGHRFGNLLVVFVLTTLVLGVVWICSRIDWGDF
jgi:hypothetical protein